VRRHADEEARGLHRPQPRQIPAPGVERLEQGALFGPQDLVEPVRQVGEPGRVVQIGVGEAFHAEPQFGPFPRACASTASRAGRVQRPPGSPGPVRDAVVGPDPSK